DPLTQAGLTAAEADALTKLYNVGAPAGAEWGWSQTDPATIGLAFRKFTKAGDDPTYFDDFWTKPGYEGTTGEANAQLVQGLSGTVSAVGAPDAEGRIFSFGSSPGFPAGTLKGYNVRFTSGALS